ncbi:hypothetical protein ACIPPJ_29810 [Streptomyces sp. NPDC086091]|uniref:hypothetical protein n=1 Tax=Streptomyces sp. NPDC086091 TaxID=3365751 RepID=UPI00382E751F
MPFREVGDIQWNLLKGASFLESEASGCTLKFLTDEGLAFKGSEAYSSDGDQDSVMFVTPKGRELSCEIFPEFSNGSTVFLEITWEDYDRLCRWQGGAATFPRGIFLDYAHEPFRVSFVGADSYVGPRLTDGSGGNPPRDSKKKRSALNHVCRILRNYQSDRKTVTTETSMAAKSTDIRPPAREASTSFLCGGSGGWSCGR